MKNIRTCISCREKFDKSTTNLIKITKVNDEFVIKPNNKIFGRSVYICNNKECINKAIKNKLLSKAFKQNVSLDVYNKLSNL